MATGLSARAEAAVTRLNTQTANNFFIFCFLGSLVGKRLSVHLHTAEHAGLKVPRQQTGKFKTPSPIEGPEDALGLTRLHMRHIGLVVSQACGPAQVPPTNGLPGKPGGSI